MSACDGHHSRGTYVQDGEGVSPGNNGAEHVTAVAVPAAAVAAIVVVVVGSELLMGSERAQRTAPFKYSAVVLLRSLNLFRRSLSQPNPIEEESTGERINAHSFIHSIQAKRGLSHTPAIAFTPNFILPASPTSCFCNILALADGAKLS